MDKYAIKKGDNFSRGSSFNILWNQFFLRAATIAKLNAEIFSPEMFIRFEKE